MLVLTVWEDRELKIKVLGVPLSGERPSCFKHKCLRSCFGHVQLLEMLRTVAFIRLLCPPASPDKNTGVGCHALLQGYSQSCFIDGCLLACVPHMVKGARELSGVFF